MNARAVKKRLMRKRVTGFWGERAYLTVKIPAHILESVPPKYVPETDDGVPMQTDIFDGSWRNEADTERISMHRYRSGTKPEDTEGLHLLAVDAYGDWTWWEGEWRCKKSEEAGWERFILVPEEIDAYRTYAEFMERLQEEGVHPLLDGFVKAGYSAKSVDIDVSNGFIVFTYGVKWFYPDRKFAFCADLSRAIRKAARNGLKIRL